MNFNASHFHANEEDEILVVSLSDASDNPEHYLILQKHLNPSDDDRELGLDSIYVESSEEIESGYGAIKKVVIKNDEEINFYSDTKALRLLFSINLRLPPEDMVELREKINIMMR